MMIVDPTWFGGVAPATVSYIGPYTPTNAGTTSTATGVSFGAVAPRRLIVVTVFWGATAAGSSISSATIGGNPASVAVQGGLLAGPSSTVWTSAIIAAFVPLGTSGTVVVNFSGGGSVGSYFFVHQATNVRYVTPFGTGQVISASTPISTTCNLDAGGFVIAGALTRLVSSPFTFSGVTKDYEQASLGTVGGGSTLTPSAVTGASFQMSDPGGTAGGPFRTMIVASFR